MAEQNEVLEMIEMGFDEMDEFGSGITAMSIVKSPAIKSKFMKFAEEKPMRFAEADSEKRLLIGPALVPDLPIFRKKDDGTEYYCYFKEDTIEKLAYAFLKQGRQNNSTIEHEFAVDGVGMVESWIVTDPENDKSKALGMDVPKGTWMIAMKVQSEEVWDAWVKTGKVEGFSVEAMLLDKTPEKTEQSEEIPHNFDKRASAAIDAMKKLYEANKTKA